MAVLTSLDGDLLLERGRLLRGRSGRVSWTLNDERTSSLEPNVLDLAREKVTRCIELTLTSERPLVGPSGRSICSGDAHARLVRFVAAAVTDQREMARLELLDAAGAVLRVDEGVGELPFELANPRVLRARRVAGRIGRPSLWETTLRAGDETRRCLALTAGPRPAADERCQATRSHRSVLLDASCASRRLTVAVVIASGTRVRADVGASSPRSLRMRNGVGLLTLPASKPLRALSLIRNGRSRRVQIQAPAAARQCGWNAVREIEQG